jgi:hypothetical protein
VTRRRWLLAWIALAVAPSVAAQTPRTIRIDLELRQRERAARAGAGARGGVVITDRGAPRAGGLAGVERVEVRRSARTAMFTLVQDGSEAMLLVASDVPAPQLAFYRDYATGQGHLTSGVTFRRAGTALRVHAQALADGRIRVRLTPSISWESADGTGTLVFVEAATDVVVPDGRAVVVAGASTATHTVTRELLGIGRHEESGETVAVLTARLSR